MRVPAAAARVRAELAAGSAGNGPARSRRPQGPATIAGAGAPGAPVALTSADLGCGVPSLWVPALASTPRAPFPRFLPSHPAG